MRASVQEESPAGQRITIVSASVGAGHDGAAAELSTRLTAAGFRVDRLDYLDLLPCGLGRTLRRSYALQLRVAPGSWGALLSGIERHHAMGATATRIGRLATRRTLRAIPDGTSAVVSTYPLASQALGALRSRGLLDIPVTTYLTDLSVHPLWVSPGVDAHVALHPVAAEQAHRLGARGIRVAAPAVPAAFRPALTDLERRVARLRFGLPSGVPLALVVAGSWGVGDVARTASDIAASGRALPVVVCGHNTALRDEVQRLGAGVALGWVDDMPALMRACDVVVQNAGGLSSLEALATGLPVISYRCLPGHGSTNAAALHDAGWARWVRGPQELGEALRCALAMPYGPSLLTGPDPVTVIAGSATRTDRLLTAIPVDVAPAAVPAIPVDAASATMSGLTVDVAPATVPGLAVDAAPATVPDLAVAVAGGAR